MVPAFERRSVAKRDVASGQQRNEWPLSEGDVEPLNVSKWVGPDIVEASSEMNNRLRLAELPLTYPPVALAGHEPTRRPLSRPRKSTVISPA
jgi:hypothetical protein